VLPWGFIATGYTQEPAGAGCAARELGRGCQTALQTSSDGNATLASSAPNSPVVTYINGKLTVAALNTSLAEVLRAITARTGTVIDFPAGSAADRIAVQEGPDTIQHVLANLLNGSGFNYVILTSPNAPARLTRVVLAKSDQTASSPQPESNQISSTAEEPKTIDDPLLWAPPGGSSFLTSPKKEDPSAAVSPRTPDGESVVTPQDPIPPDVLEQMMKDRTRHLHEQAQPPQ
jgi:hypothetical protein